MWIKTLRFYLYFFLLYNQSSNKTTLETYLVKFSFFHRSFWSCGRMEKREERKGQDLIPANLQQKSFCQIGSKRFSISGSVVWGEIYTQFVIHFIILLYLTSIPISVTTCHNNWLIVTKSDQLSQSNSCTSHL